MPERFRSFILKYEHVIVILLIITGGMLRILFIGSCPAGLNQDEASAGYEAWSLLNYGTDRNGISWPVLFISWGSGQNVLYSYLSIPFIKLLGLNEFSIRLLSGITGTVTLPVFWHMTRIIKGPSAAIVSLFVLTLCPWHIMISRWALESNLLPFFLLLGIYFTVLSIKKPKAIIAAGAAFGVSLYAYGTAFIFLPPFLIMTVIYLKMKGWLRIREFLTALAIFIFTALPITLCNFINIIGWDEISFFGITLPILTQTRQAATVSFSPGNFADFLKLLINQSDGLAYNSVDGFMYFPGYWIFALAGVCFTVYDGIKRRDSGEMLILFAVAASFIASFFISININRMNMAFIPTAWFTAYGIYRLIRLAFYSDMRIGAGCIVCAFLLVFISTGHAGRVYLTDTQDTLSVWFFEGLGDAVQYAEEICTEKVYITDSINSPYIFVLFYNRIPPEEFYETVEYLNPDGAFRKVLSFSKYIFGGDDPGGDTVYILAKSESSGYEILAEFGNYAVCR